LIYFLLVSFPGSNIEACIAEDSLPDCSTVLQNLPDDDDEDDSPEVSANAG
jgi:hypothetical protein